MSETIGGEPDGKKSVLAKEQQALVDTNLGLVGVHLAHHVPTPKCPTRERERDDLFQVGGLALVRAAFSYHADEHGGE